MELRIKFGHGPILLLVILSTFVVCFTDGTPDFTGTPKYGEVKKNTDSKKLENDWTVNSTSKPNTTPTVVGNKNKLSSLIPLLGGFFGIMLVLFIVYVICNRINRRSAEEYESIISPSPAVTAPDLPRNPGYKDRRKLPALIPERNDGNPRRYLHSNLRITYSAPTQKSALADYFNGPDYQPQRAYVLTKSCQYQSPPSEIYGAGHRVLSTKSFTRPKC